MQTNFPRIAEKLERRLRQRYFRNADVFRVWRLIDVNRVPIDLQVRDDTDPPCSRGQLAGQIRNHGAFETGRKAHVFDHAQDRKSTRLNSSHGYISYAVFCLKKKTRANRRAQEYFMASSLSRSVGTSLVAVAAPAALWCDTHALSDSRARTSRLSGVKRCLQ